MLSDKKSWINAYLLDVILDWEAQGHAVTWKHDVCEAQPMLDRRPGCSHDEPSTNFCFCLSFSQILPSALRERFEHTLVVHESDLPQGKGWSPLTWQILEGANRIPVTLIEAAARVDSGPIYAKRWLEFQGNELIDELRAGQAEATHQLCRWFVDRYPQNAEQARSQQGEESFYPRRRPADSRLDADKSLTEQFELLRVVDNDHYPAFFELRGNTYRLTIMRM